MFLHLSVILFNGAGCIPACNGQGAYTYLGRHFPRQTPPLADSPRVGTLLGRHPLKTDLPLTQMGTEVEWYASRLECNLV